MKTTIELPDDLVREIKMKSVIEGRRLKDTITDLLRAGLTSGSKESSRRGGRATSAFPVIKCRRAAKPAEELTPQRVADILTRQEADWYAKTRR